MRTDGLLSPHVPFVTGFAQHESGGHIFCQPDLFLRNVLRNRKSLDTSS